MQAKAHHRSPCPCAGTNLVDPLSYQPKCRGTTDQSMPPYLHLTRPSDLALLTSPPPLQNCSVRQSPPMSGALGTIAYGSVPDDFITSGVLLGPSTLNFHQRLVYRYDPALSTSAPASQTDSLPGPHVLLEIFIPLWADFHAWFLLFLHRSTRPLWWCLSRVGLFI